MVTRRARRSVEVRREEILSATVELLDRLGLAATRVADVAAGARRQPGAGLLPLRHQGRAGRRGVRARRRARPAAGWRRRRSGDDPVERLRRVLRLYGPTGRATGWRIWIDAWAVGPARARTSARCCSGSTTGGRTSCAAWSTTASRPASSPAPTRRRRVARLSALVDGLSVAVGGAPQRDPRAAAQLGGRPARGGARRGRRDAGLTSDQPVRGVVGLGQRRPVEPERRHVGRGLARGRPGRPAPGRRSART